MSTPRGPGGWETSGPAPRTDDAPAMKREPTGASRGYRWGGPSLRTMSIIVLLAVPAFLLLVAPDVLLIVFAGLLFGVFFGGGGEWLARRLGIGRKWGVGLFVVLVLLALTGAFSGFAPTIAEQFDRLVEEIPPAVDSLRSRLEDYAWGEDLLRRAKPGDLMTSGGAATAVTTTFGALGNLVIMLFVGLYVALDPEPYRRGLVSLLAPSARTSGQQVLATATDALRNWLKAQMMAMTVVGVLTWLGLWIIGIPLAPILGLIAALLAFIPNIGPIIAAVPAVLLAVADGPTTALLVVGVYVAVQTLESYVITPLIQQEQVSLPPVLIISMQLLLGVLFGLLGLALATPLAAFGLTMVKEVYVDRYLAGERPDPQDPHDAGVPPVSERRARVP